MQKRQKVYDLYWYFAAERQNIFFNKVNNKFPLTKDLIFVTYKFCNTYRASDRVSQYLIRNVIYTKKKYSNKDVLFRIFLFRLIDKIETWELLEVYLGEINLESFNFKKYVKAFEKILLKQHVVYGNAFILSGNKIFGFNEKYKNHLMLMQKVFIDDKYDKILLNSKSLKELFLNLKKLSLIGNFMAYQIAIDFNYSLTFNFSENDFTVAGPGAIRGIEKCFANKGNKTYEEIIMMMVKNQDEEFKRLKLNFKNLYGRKLTAIDCQGLFCEVDKYTRVKFPELKSERIRIKAKYRENKKRINYFYPPKWKLII